jgi:hypothetical protein
MNPLSTSECSALVLIAYAAAGSFASAPSGIVFHVWNSLSGPVMCLPACLSTFMSVKCVAYAEAEVTSTMVDGPQRTLSISEACLYAPHPCVRHYRPVWTMVKCSSTQDLRVGVQALWKVILSIPEPAASIREAALGASGHRVVVSPCQDPEPTTPIWERHSEPQVVMSPTARVGPRVSTRKAALLACHIRRFLPPI